MAEYQWLCAEGMPDRCPCNSGGVDPYALEVVNELIRRGSDMARERDRYRQALEHIAVHGEHGQECRKPPQDCAADALETP